MNNFPYIIAGLPQLVLDFETKKSNFSTLVESIYINCSKSDQRLIDWLLFAVKEENLNRHFYRMLGKTKNIFLKDFYEYDLLLRNIKTAYLWRKFKISGEPHFIGESEIIELLRTNKSADFGLTMIMDEAPKIFQILDNPDILEREQQIDMLRWNRANEICLFRFFDINVILSFILKAAIIERWNKLDKKEGARMLEMLLGELKSSKDKAEEELSKEIN